MIVRDCTFAGQYTKAPVWFATKKAGPDMRFVDNTPPVQLP